MSDIWGVIIIPAEKDPGELQTDGSCGAMPPHVGYPGCICVDCGRECVTYQNHCTHCGGPWNRTALPLFWDHLWIPEAWMLLCLALDVQDSDRIETLHPSRAQIETVADWAARQGLGTVVRLRQVDGRLEAL